LLREEPSHRENRDSSKKNGSPAVSCGAPASLARSAAGLLPRQFFGSVALRILFEAILLHGMVKLEGARCCLCFVRLEACLTLLAGSAHMQLRLCARGQCPACGDCAFGLVRHGKASRRNPPSPLTLASGRLVGDFFAVPVCVCLFVLVRTSSEPVALPNATRPESSRGLAAGQIWSSAARVVGGGLPPAGVPDRKCVRFKQTHS